MVDSEASMDNVGEPENGEKMHPGRRPICYANLVMLKRTDLLCVWAKAVYSFSLLRYLSQAIWHGQPTKHGSGALGKPG
jgi:hypothetical protein